MPEDAGDSAGDRDRLVPDLRESTRARSRIYYGTSGLDEAVDLGEFETALAREGYRVARISGTGGGVWDFAWHVMLQLEGEVGKDALDVLEGVVVTTLVGKIKSRVGAPTKESTVVIIGPDSDVLRVVKVPGRLRSRVRRLLGFAGVHRRRGLQRIS